MRGSVLPYTSGDTPSSGQGFFAAPGVGLPPDLLREASVRLGHAALIYAGVWLLAYFGPYILDPWMPFSEFVRHFSTLVGTVAILSGIAVYLVSRFANLRPALLLDLGLMFEVVGAIGIAISSMWALFPEDGTYLSWLQAAMDQAALTGIPWECVWILIFPLIAPNTIGKTALASLASASAGPLILIISKSAGATSPDVPIGGFMVYYATSTYLCAGLAVIISRGVYKYGKRLSKAREIGSYRLIERLGEGGMGEVWLAKHRMLARPAAIKLIRGEALGADESTRTTIVRRFEREAQATAALRSHNTIELYDFGVTAEGAFYYVMELLDGLSLKELVDRFGPVPPERTIRILRQACKSLGEAHERGLIHRDIKPANIFLCRLGPDVDVVKVLDFGLVKTSQKAHQETALTRGNVVAGTPSYMPPEMAAGQEVDGRADLYSLGCVGYWLLTGQPVFEGDTPLTTILQHVQDEPVPPSRRTELEIPEDLETIILSCLEKNPANRPGTASDLEASLAACSVEEEWTDKLATEWWKLHGPERTT